MSGYIGNIPTPQATQSRQNFTATASQTTFATIGYTPGYVDVYLNGVHLLDGTDYTATNGSDVVLTTGAALNDIVEVISYETFSVLDQSFTGTTTADILTTTGAFTSLGIDDNATSTAMTLDSTGNVGIGTSSPSRQLDIYGANPAMQFTDSDGSYGQIVTGAGSLSIRADEGNTVANSYIRMEVDGSEAMRIDSSGNLLVGKTSPTISSAGVELRPSGQLFATQSANYPLLLNRLTSDGDIATFRKSGTTVGSISVTASATAYNTSSDYRLKEAWVPMADASTRVQALKPINFAWKVDGSRVDGFLAHELAEVVPEAATGAKDAMRDEEYEITPAVEATYDDEGVELTSAVPAVMGTRSVPDYQGIDQSKLVPLLTAALQEAITEITALKARVTALEVTP